MMANAFTSAPTLPVRTTASIRVMADVIADLSRSRPRPLPSPVVAVSGIDASGKGYVSGRVAAELGRRGMRVALVNLDPWHHPQTVRFSRVDPGAHFYRNAFRWDDFFGRLVRPLAQRRSIRLTERLIEVAQDRYYTHTYDFRDIDVLILEGIFLLKRELRDRYDLAWWIECSFETALRRAIARNQEGLPEAALVADFRRIYFAAQRHHFAEDDPAGSADAVFLNEYPRSRPPSCDAAATPDTVPEAHLLRST